MKRSLSHSSYTVWTRCPQKYFHKYVAERGGPTVEDPQTPDLLAGNGVHAAIEYAIKRTMAGEEITVEDACNAGISAANDIYNRCGLTTGSTLSDILGDTAESLSGVFERIRRTSSWFLNKEFASLKPVEAERKFDIVLPGTNGWTLNGKIDLVQAHPEGALITDWKVSKRAPEMDRADVSSQLSFYALAHWLEYKEVPAELKLVFIIDSQRIHTVERSTYRTVEDCKRWLDRLVETCHAIEAAEASGKFSPCDPELVDKGKPVCCGQRCAYYMVCPFGAKH